MARIRTIKPTFWSDLAVAHLRRDARLMLVGLISFADDEGRFLASTSAIAGYVFPHDELPLSTIKRWRDEVVKSGVVGIYTVDGCEYGYFPNWDKHQRINRPSPSIYPPPPEWLTTSSVNGSLNDSRNAQ